MTRWISPWVVPGAMLAAALAIYPAIALQAAPVLAGLGGLAFVLFITGQTLPVPGALAWALGLLAIEYLATLELRGASVDVAAPGYGAALFLCAELGWLGLEAKDGGRLWTGRAVAVVLLALLGGALGAVLLLLAAAPLAGGVVLTALGVAAAVAIAACLAWLARS